MRGDVEGMRGDVRWNSGGERVCQRGARAWRGDVEGWGGIREKIQQKESEVNIRSVCVCCFLCCGSCLLALVGWLSLLVWISSNIRKYIQ